MKKAISLALLILFVLSCATFPVKKQFYMVKQGILNCTLEVEDAYQDGYLSNEQYEKLKSKIETAARLYNRAVKVYKKTGKAPDELSTAILVLEEVEDILRESKGGSE